MKKPDTTHYSAHETLVSSARARPEIWRLLVGLGIVAAVTITLSSLISSFVLAIAPNFYRTELSLSAPLGTSPISMLILMASFAFVTLGVAIAARMMQKRNLRSITGSIPLSIRQFWRVFRLLLVLGAVLFVLQPFDVGASPVQNMPFTSWLALLPLSLVAIFIQTSAEEILFRGYLQQTLAARFSNPLIWMVLPSALFAWGHFAPDEVGQNAVLIAVWAGVFGLLAADLTARSGTLGPAIALHLF
ncbi:MAG: CPBP family intramembrane metalloprotease, partial [Rhodobacteraceae bacterium]|nr:CPBP family intramembrane metalloprotease [Paracoccaceae bacterium]